MLHRDVYDIEITGEDIDKAMVEHRSNPIQLACARAMRKAVDEISTSMQGIFVSVYDYGDFIKYKYDDNCAGQARTFLVDWEDWMIDYSTHDDAICYCEPFHCKLNLERMI